MKAISYRLSSLLFNVHLGRTSQSHLPQFLEREGPANQHANISWPMVPMLPERPAQGRPPEKGDASFQVKPHENFAACPFQVVFLLCNLVGQYMAMVHMARM